MDVLFLVIGCLLFFTYSSIVTTRFVFILNSFKMTTLQTIIIIILTHVGYYIGITLYDIAKKFNIVKFFIGGSLMFATLQIMLNYSNGDFKAVSIIGLLLFCTSSLVDLCCNMLGRYVPVIFTVFLRNLGSLIASLIHLKINYVEGVRGKNLVLYLACSSILSLLITNVNVKLNINKNIASMKDVFLIYREYSGIFWSFIYVNLIDMLLLKYLGYFLFIINKNIKYGLSLEMSFYLGRLILHYPMMLLLSHFKSRAKIIIPQVLNLIMLISLPILYYYSYYNTALIMIFVMGAMSLLRHGITLYFKEIIREEHKLIVVDVTFSKIRSICYLLSFLLELILIAGWNIGAYIIIALFQLISIGGFIMM